MLAESALVYSEDLAVWTYDERNDLGSISVQISTDLFGAAVNLRALRQLCCCSFGGCDILRPNVFVWIGLNFGGCLR